MAVAVVAPRALSPPSSQLHPSRSPPSAQRRVLRGQHARALLQLDAHEAAFPAAVRAARRQAAGDAGDGGGGGGSAEQQQQQPQLPPPQQQQQPQQPQQPQQQLNTVFFCGSAV